MGSTDQSVRPDTATGQARESLNGDSNPTCYIRAG
jgi:hypothetical protein